MEDTLFDPGKIEIYPQRIVYTAVPLMCLKTCQGDKEFLPFGPFLRQNVQDW